MLAGDRFCKQSGVHASPLHHSPFLVARTFTWLGIGNHTEVWNRQATVIVPGVPGAPGTAAARPRGVSTADLQRFLQTGLAPNGQSLTEVQRMQIMQQLRLRQQQSYVSFSTKSAQRAAQTPICFPAPPARRLGGLAVRLLGDAESVLRKMPLAASLQASDVARSADIPPYCC